MKLRHALTLPAFAAMLATSAVAQEEPNADTVLATVNGTEITVGHIISLTASLPPQYYALPDDILLEAALDQLIQQTAIGADAELDSRRLKISLENETRAVMASDVLDRIGESASTEEKIKAAYEAEHMTGQENTEYRASHILVNTEEEALQIIDRLNNEADFAELAKEKSTGPSGASGGDLGWFQEGRMVPAFSAVVVKMQVGAISRPVKNSVWMACYQACGDPRGRASGN